MMQLGVSVKLVVGLVLAVVLAGCASTPYRARVRTEESAKVAEMKRSTTPFVLAEMPLPSDDPGRYDVEHKESHLEVAVLLVFPIPYKVDAEKTMTDRETGDRWIFLEDGDYRIERADGEEWRVWTSGEYYIRYANGRTKGRDLVTRDGQPQWKYWDDGRIGTPDPVRWYEPI